MFKNIGLKLSKVFSSAKQKVDENMLEKIEEKLLLSDISIDLIDKILYSLKNLKSRNDITLNELKISIKSELQNQIMNIDCNTDFIDRIKQHDRPYTIIFSGINGAGKTTTIAKIAYKLKQQGLKVLICAADTFRAVASDQLKSWAEKINTEIIYNDNLSPSSLVFDAYKKSIDDSFDVLLIDTAGRLQTRNDLMEELNKIIRVLKKQNENSPNDSILVLDASTGQNMISQAETFIQFANITGFILTKLDGSSKGGAVISLLKKYKLPIYMIGSGESIEDITSFEIDDYLNNLLDF